MKKLVPQSIKNIYHLGQAILANFWYGFPSQKIKVIGVTGTNGKTTTVQMITKILEEAGKKVAMASTINFRINGLEEKNLSHYTTESSFAIQNFIKKSVQEKCEYLVLETSSHSIDQYRVWGINYHTAVITNITREHLDYHKTMESYRKVKLKLFEKVKTAVVNLDMENPEEFMKLNTTNKFGYTICHSEPRECHSELDSESGSRIKSGMTSGDVEILKAENIELGIDGSKYEISVQGGPALGWQDTNFKLNIPGIFNIENALAATCVGLSENISLEAISKTLEKIKGVPGRMEYVENDRGLDIVVDFALTPDALDKLFGFLLKTKKSDSKIIAVFGSCGERDRGKRPMMGEIVSQYADFVIVTNDEPYHEDPNKIIEEIAAGITNKKENGSFWKIPDRREAIQRALEIAKSGDIIAVTGMGAEESMVVGDEKIPWNDRKVIEEELAKI